MKSKMTFFMAVGLLSLSSIFATSEELRADAKQDAVAEFVTHMGYGNGIHVFKNLVLRGERKFLARSGQSFKKALKAAKKIGPEGKDIVAMIENYAEKAKEVEKLRAKGSTAEEVDNSVKISDGPALKALGAIVGGMKLTKVQELEYLLGYGGAIHAFKNFVLRGKNSEKATKYRKAAEEKFNKAKALAVELKATDVAGTIDEYLKALKEAADFHGKGQSAKQIDASIKISDKSAKAQLKKLRKK